jgi:hypothetical protein
VKNGSNIRAFLTSPIPCPLSNIDGLRPGTDVHLSTIRHRISRIDAEVEGDPVRLCQIGKKSRLFLRRARVQFNALWQEPGKDLDWVSHDHGEIMGRASDLSFYPDDERALGESTRLLGRGHHLINISP